MRDVVVVQLQRRYAREFMNERPLRSRTDVANGLPFSARQAAYRIFVDAM